MNIEDLSILVTGGAGFIGSHITEYLLKNGAKFVRVLDNLSTGTMENINDLINNYDNLEFINGDIRNIETCRTACEGISVICHQAALGSVPRSVKNPLESHDSNVNGFLNILVAAIECGIKRIVYASSSSVYGTNDSIEKIEDETRIPLSPYAVTKLFDEYYAKVFTMIYGLECIGLRYFNVFGPRQNPNGPYAAVIPKFISLIGNNERPLINGDGSYTRDFTYVDNVVSANVLSLLTTNSKCYGEAFNVGMNNRISINDLCDTIKKILNKPDIEPIYGPVRVGDVSNSCACIDKIREHLGYFPKVNFEKGLKKTIQFYLS